MPNVEQLIAWLEAHRGVPYSQPRRWEEGFFDCSSYITRGLQSLGIHPPSSVSSGLARWSYNNGRAMGVNAGISTRGVMLFMGPDRGLAGYGSDGHVALSLGDGRVIETPSAGRRSGISTAYGRNWTGAGTIPGLSYDTSSEDDELNELERATLKQVHDWLKAVVEGSPDFGVGPVPRNVQEIHDKSSADVSAIADAVAAKIKVPTAASIAKELSKRLEE